jgi:hypothetical protein
LSVSKISVASDSGLGTSVRRPRNERSEVFWVISTGCSWRGEYGVDHSILPRLEAPAMGKVNL